MVAGYLQKLQVAVNTVILDIYSTFYIWFYLHLYFKYIILMQNFFLSFFLNIFFRLLSNNIYIIWIFLLLALQFCHFDSFLHCDFRRLFGSIFSIIILNYMDDFLLMHVCYNINSNFWVCRFYLYYIKYISLAWLFHLILNLWAFLCLIGNILICFIAN